MYNSETWLDAKSVAFIGNGGALKFTSETTGVKVPNTVKQITGFNTAIIEIARLDSEQFPDTNKGGIWYAEAPATPDYKISNMTLGIKNSMAPGSSYGFLNCNYLDNCKSDSYASVGAACGFYNCKHIINCSGDGKSSSGTGGSGFKTVITL